MNITPTERKQNYLYEEIIGQGYDSEIFMNFMAESKEDGTNIEKWTMAELLNIVTEFKQTHPVVEKHEVQNVQKPNQPYQNGQNNVTNSQNTRNLPQNQQQHESHLQRYEREQRTQPQNEIQQRGGQQNSNYNSNQGQRPSHPQYQNNQPPHNQNQQQMNRPQQRLSNGMQGNPQYPNQQQIKQSPQQMYQNQKSLLDDDDDPFAQIPVKPTNNQPQGGNFDFGFNNNMNNNSNQMSNSQFKNNNNLINSQLQNNQPIINGNQQNMNANQSNMRNNGPSNNKTPQNSDPFAMFSSPQTNKPQNNSNNNSKNNNDIFESFFTPTPQQQNLPQQGATPSQIGNSQQPVQQPIRRITESDIDEFFLGVSPNNNSNPNKNNGQIKSPQNDTKKQNVGRVPSLKGNSTIAEVPIRNVSQIIEKDDFEVNEACRNERMCKKSVQTVVGVNPDLQVEINDHELVSGSLFSIGGNIAIYHVKTLPFNWVVKRKYNDFIWLRSILIKMYPGLPIPPLPGKTMKSLDEKMVTRRKGYFESFLREILSQPDLKSSKFITDFLSIVDEKTFKQKIKESEKLQRPKNVQDIETTMGKVTLNKNPECNAHSLHIHNFFEQNDQQYLKLKKLSKQLVEGYNSVVNVLHQMGDIFGQLHANVVNYNSKTIQPIQVKELEETYKIMNNMFVQQSSQFSSQIKLFQNDFYNFFKFHKDSLTGFKEVVKTRNELNSILAKKDANESTGLSGIFRSSKDAVFHPSKVLKELEEQVGYYNEQMMQGSKYILNSRATAYSRHFIKYSNKQMQIVNDVSPFYQLIFYLKGVEYHIFQNNKIAY